MERIVWVWVLSDFFLLLFTFSIPSKNKLPNLWGKTDTLSLKEENVRDSLGVMGTGKDFLNRTLIALSGKQQLINGT